MHPYRGMALAQMGFTRVAVVGIVSAAATVPALLAGTYTPAP